MPLLERVKFLAIFSSNLDEFFMVRVAGLKRNAGMGEPAPGPDGLTAGETLAAISERVHELVGAQHRCFLDEIQPLLAAEGVRILRPEDLDAEQRRFLDQYFRRALLPVLTPLAIDPGIRSRTWPIAPSASWPRSARSRPRSCPTPRSPSSTSRVSSCPASSPCPRRPANTPSCCSRT